MCSGCHQYAYCRPPNKKQLKMMYHVERDRVLSQRCQMKHWKSGHKKECPLLAAKAAEAAAEAAEAAARGAEGKDDGGDGAAKQERKGKKKRAPTTTKKKKKGGRR